jgi:thiol-disulfide isomerase/thioredoxin
LISVGNGWSSGLIVAAAVLVAATAAGVLWRARQGRLRAVSAAAVSGAAGADDRATLLLFTTPTCGNCQAVRAVSAAVAADLDGVTFQEVDATVEPDRARELNVWRAPTLFVLDAAGVPVWRATGVPRHDELTAAARSAVSERSERTVSEGRDCRAERGGRVAGAPSRSEAAPARDTAVC